MHHFEVMGGPWELSHGLGMGNVFSCLAWGGWGGGVLITAGIQGRGGEISEQMGGYAVLGEF